MTFIVGCNTLNQPKINSTKKVCLENLKKNLEENWRLNDDSVFYQTNYGFLVKLDTVYDECLNMFYQSEIIKLFGHPTETHKLPDGSQIQTSFDYLVSMPCKETADNFRCDYFVFYFDSEKRVVRSERVSHFGLKSH